VAHGKSTVVKAISGVQVITNIDPLIITCMSVCSFYMYSNNIHLILYLEKYLFHIMSLR
jgi:hypothetical protein